LSLITNRYPRMTFGPPHIPPGSVPAVTHIRPMVLVPKVRDPFRVLIFASFLYLGLRPHPSPPCTIRNPFASPTLPNFPFILDLSPFFSEADLMIHPSLAQRPISLRTLVHSKLPAPSTFRGIRDACFVASPFPIYRIVLTTESNSH